jgi:cytidylate kinase
MKGTFMGVFENHYGSYISSQVKSLKHKILHEKRAEGSFVTISRQTGAYSFTIPKALCEYLKKHDRRAKSPWTVFDKELIEKIAYEHNLPQTVIPYLSEESVSELQDMIEEALGLHPSHSTLVNNTGKTIFHLAQLGYCIIVGRAANILTAKLSGGVHIRLVGPLEKRIEHIREYHQLTKKEAEMFIFREDRNRGNYVKQSFGRDINDPLMYDAVLNVDRLGFQKTIQIIGDLVFKRFLPC